MIGILRLTHDLSDAELLACLECDDSSFVEELHAAAREACAQQYGKVVFIRGLIEFTNICKNDCYYCGIRRSNSKVDRYRLSKEDVLDCCTRGHAMGFRTFVLQGGEDGQLTDAFMCDLVSEIHRRFDDCAITLSIGERSRESYQRLYDAGAQRYLLRHETATAEHYARLHPKALMLKHRMNCLQDLKEIGYQVGCGLMVGSPFQTCEHLVRDLRYIKELQPHMVGIGPFIPHHDTPFRDYPAGSTDMTLKLLSLVRLLVPGVLLPATTALGTALGDGRERGVLAGANVVMPNLSPLNVREKYSLYDNKLCTGDETAEQLEKLRERFAGIGYQVAVSRGDSLLTKNSN